VFWPLVLIADLYVFLAITGRKVGWYWQLAGGAALAGTTLLFAVFVLSGRLDLLGAAATTLTVAWKRHKAPWWYLVGALTVAAYLVGAFVTAPALPKLTGL
jgi:hypothetical protein